MICIVRPDVDFLAAIGAIHLLHFRVLVPHVVDQLIGGVEGQEAVGTVASAGKVHFAFVEVGTVLGGELLVAVTAAGRDLRFDWANRLPRMRKGDVMVKQKNATFKNPKL